MPRYARLAGHAANPALVLGLAALALHLWANGGYGVFRDELYYIVCGWRLAWGYVDQPPLAPLVAALSWDAFGGSVLGLRLVPAASAAALVALTVHTAGRLGGGRYAGWLAGACVLAAGVLQTMGVLLTTDTLQPLAWLGCTYAVIRAQRGGPGWWWAVGTGAGLGFLWKYTVAFHLGAVGLGLLLTPARRLLAGRGPWIALGLATLIALPNLAWQAAHGWPFLEHAAVLAASNERLSWVGFLGQQVLLLNPVTAPVWMAGLAAFVAWRRFADLRWVAVAWALLVGAAAAAHGKAYYLAGAYPLLFAGGAVALETWLTVPALRGALAGLVVAGGAATAPLAMPLLPPAALAAYVRRLGGAMPGTGERLATGPLPQIWADTFGWRAMADAVARAYAALPPEDQARAVFFGRNYGEAAAVDVLAAGRGLPPSVSGHQTYFLWGPRGHDGAVVLRVGGTQAGLLRAYATVEQVGWLDDPWALPAETGVAVWLCRGRKVDLRDDWAGLKHYE